MIIAQGGAFGGWSLYAQGRQADVLLQPARPAAVQDRRRRSRSRPASTRCGWSSPTTAAAWPRAATVTPLHRRRPRSATDASTRRCRWSSPPTRPPTSARHRLARQRRLHPRDQPLHRDGQLGPDRPRRGRPRPPDHARGAAPGRHGAPVNCSSPLARPWFWEAQAQPPNGPVDAFRQAGSRGSGSSPAGVHRGSAARPPVSPCGRGP